MHALATANSAIKMRVHVLDLSLLIDSKLTGHAAARLAPHHAVSSHHYVALFAASPRCRLDSHHPQRSLQALHVAASVAACLSSAFTVAACLAAAFTVAACLLPAAMDQASEDLFSTQMTEDPLERGNTLSQDLDEDLPHLSPSAAISPQDLSGTQKKGTKKKRPATADDDDDLASTQGDSPVLHTSRKKAGRTYRERVSFEDEDDIVEWFRNHPALYAKKAIKYMDSAYKQRLLDDKAKSLGISSEYIMIFAMFSL